MQQPADVVVRPAIKHVPRSVVRDAHERIVRCGLGIVPVSSETEDKFEDAMEVTASSPLFELARVLRASRSRCQLHRKRESQHRSQYRLQCLAYAPEVRRQVVIAAHLTIFTRHFGAAARGPVLPNPNLGVAVGV
jgi:hypothetical protein